MSDAVFNALTDNLFGFLAQIGLRRNSAELKSDDGEVDYRKAYDAVIALARKGHSECLEIREAMLANPHNPEKEE